MVYLKNHAGYGKMAIEWCSILVSAYDSQDGPKNP